MGGRALKHAFLGALVLGVVLCIAAGLPEDAVVHEAAAQSPEGTTGLGSTIAEVVTPESLVLEAVTMSTTPKLDLDSRISERNMWSFLGIISFLLLFTVLFEFMKETIIEEVKGTPNEELVMSIFSELTVLGFLALVTFLIGKLGLDHLSMMVYGHSDVDEDKAKLGDILEKIHMVIFLIMCLFIVEAIGMLVIAKKKELEWAKDENTVITPPQRDALVARFKNLRPPTCIERLFRMRAVLKEGAPPTDEKWGLNHLSYQQTERLVQFMLARQKFIHDDPNTKLDPGFCYSLYLTKTMGLRLAKVIELPFQQWLFLEFLVVIIICSSIALDCLWQWVLWVWVCVGWIQLLFSIAFMRYLDNLLYMLSYHIEDEDQVKLLDTEALNKLQLEHLRHTEDALTSRSSLSSPRSPSYQKHQVEKVRSTGQALIAQLSKEESEIGKEAIKEELERMMEDLPEDALMAAAPVPYKRPTVDANRNPHDQWIVGFPRYIYMYLEKVVKEPREGDVEAPTEQTPLTSPRLSYEDAKQLKIGDVAPEVGWIPLWCKGHYLTSKDSSQQKSQTNRLKRDQMMYNMLWFGRNEVDVHLFFMRVLFLVVAVHLSVFYIQIISSYVLQVYDTYSATVIIVLTTLPGMIIYFVFVFDIIDKSVRITATDAFRSGRTVNDVVRFQKEARAVSMLRLMVAIMSEDSESNDEVSSLLQQHNEDDDSGVIMDRILDDKRSSLEVEKMMLIFDTFDVDHSQSLSVDELRMVFQRFGLNPDGGHEHKYGNEHDPVQQAVKTILSEMKETAHQNIDEANIGKLPFLIWMSAKEKCAARLTAEDICEYVFKKFNQVENVGDVESSLDIEELRQVLNACLSQEQRMSVGEVSQLVLELDVNDDGEFQEEEFEKWIERHSVEPEGSKFYQRFMSFCC